MNKKIEKGGPVSTHLTTSRRNSAHRWPGAFITLCGGAASSKNGIGNGRRSTTLAFCIHPNKMRQSPSVARG